MRSAFRPLSVVVAGGVRWGTSTPYQAFRREEVELFQKEGIYIARQLFDPEEIELMKQAADLDPTLEACRFKLPDGEGESYRTADLSIWNQEGDDTFGYAARCEKMVKRVEDLLGGEVYHYHSKLNKKDPQKGGTFLWHQDYGYWYHNGMLTPDLLSVVVALHDANAHNGGMEILIGSQRMGRVDHDWLGGQNTPTDTHRMDIAQQRLETRVCEMKAGDALFLNCLTLHRSGPNNSDGPRWNYVGCYNTKANNPYKEHHHASYHPLDVVPDTKLKEAGVVLTDPTRSKPMDAKDDETTREL